MAEQTTSSIVIAAAPAEVMAVIADFPAYPEWAQGMKKAEVVEQGAGRPRGHRCTSSSRPRRSRTPTRSAYDWNGDSSVTWDLVEGKMLKAMEGAYVLRAAGAGHRGHLPAGGRREHPDDRHARRKAEKVIIDTALKGLKKRVESLG